MNTIWTPEDEKRYKDLGARRDVLRLNVVDAVHSLSRDLGSADHYVQIGILVECADAVIEALTPFSRKAAAQREEEERESRQSAFKGGFEPPNSARFKQFDRIRLRNSPESGFTVEFVFGNRLIAEFYSTAFEDGLELPVINDAWLDLTGQL